MTDGAFATPFAIFSGDPGFANPSNRRDAHFLLHEFFHVYQWRNGLFDPIAYLAMYQISGEDNPWDAAADQFADDYLDTFWGAYNGE